MPIITAAALAGEVSRLMPNRMSGSVKNRFGPGGISERRLSAPTCLWPWRRGQSAIGDWRLHRDRRSRGARHDLFDSRDKHR
jgi:hypothetical protein